MYYVYVLWSEKLKKRYVGFSANPAKRLDEHNSSKSAFTKTGIPWKLIYTEEYLSETEARKREKFLKCGVGRKFLDLKLKHAGVSDLGEPRVLCQRHISFWLRISLFPPISKGKNYFEFWLEAHRFRNENFSLFPQ
jgi:putative endonuclease